MKPVVWRDVAEQDASDAALWYARQGGLALGEAFLAEVEATLERIARHPGIGSQRHATLVPGLPAPLRWLPLHRFDRFLVYYFEVPDHVEVVRIWNVARGLEALMAGEDE